MLLILVKELKMEKRVIISSFKMKSLKKMKKDMS